MAGLCVLLPALVLAALVVIDPYDSGRLGSALGHGVPPQGPRTGHASRVRDPAFDAAIIGNSHVQLLSPERLSALTGHRFVSLTVPGAGLAEQRALLRRFSAGKGDRVKAVVIGIDRYTCHAGTRLLRTDPFPFWLYADEVLRYLGGLFRLDAAEAAIRRVAVLAARGPFARRDGWWDYEEGRHWTGSLAEALARIPAEPLANGPGPFAGLDALADMLRDLPKGARAVLLLPPVYAGVLPAAGSAAAGHDDACRAALRMVAAGRPGTAILDRRIDSPQTRDPASFWDSSHFTGPVSRDLEQAIGSVLSRS